MLICDIEMPVYDGIYIAKEVKKHFPDCLIIFLTSHLKYAVTSYELQIFRYTPKSDINEKLYSYIKDAIVLFGIQRGSVYTVTKNDISERIPYKQIVYIKKDGKNSVLCCTNNREIKLRKSLREIRKEFDAGEFLTVDRGYIVNIIQIAHIDNSQVYCVTGEKLPISRSNLKAVKLRIIDYWGGKI